MTEQGPEATDEPAAENERALGEPTAISVASMAAEIAELKAELETLKDEADKRLIGWQRSQADMENYKKHSIQDLADRVRLAKAGILLDLLGVVDDFERALAADHETDATAWIEGVRLIEKKFYAMPNNPDDMLVFWLTTTECRKSGPDAKRRRTRRSTAEACLSRRHCERIYLNWPDAFIRVSPCMSTRHCCLSNTRRPR